MMNGIARYEQEPWMCIGDFNEIAWSSEKQGGSQRSFMVMENFCDAVCRCNLQVLGFHGHTYTWTNGRVGCDNVQERLDRARFRKFCMEI